MDICDGATLSACLSGFTVFVKRNLKLDMVIQSAPFSLTPLNKLKESGEIWKHFRGLNTFECQCICGENFHAHHNRRVNPTEEENVYISTFQWACLKNVIQNKKFLKRHSLYSDSTQLDYYSHYTDDSKLPLLLFTFPDKISWLNMVEKLLKSDIFIIKHINILCTRQT